MQKSTADSLRIFLSQDRGAQKEQKSQLKWYE